MMAGAVQYVWDELKRAANVAAHGIDFTAAYRFEWDTARIDPDRRRNYGEERFVGLGRIGLRIHVLVFTSRGELVRIISLRKANRREVKRYEEGQV
jgi:uncharacterized DUF497 family protein